VGEVDLAQKNLKSKIKDVEDYIRADAFTPAEAKNMLRKMGMIVASDKTGRYAIGAYRVILARAKLAYDIDRGGRPVINIDARSESGGTSVFAIAADLGLRIDTEGDGQASRSGSGDVIDGESRRPQSEDGPAAS